MEHTFAMAKRQPQEVDFLELHATGAASGDPTEANWFAKKFKRDDGLLIGSVKGNDGYVGLLLLFPSRTSTVYCNHLEITALLDSLTKVIDMFETGLVPPS